MALIGRRFVQVSETKNQTEAEYRYVLTRLRENGESIALIRGEEEERAGVARSLRRVMAAWAALAVQNVKTTLVSQTSSYIAPVLADNLVRPEVSRWFDDARRGHAAASAFTIVQAAFNWLVDNYPKMADWTASARRVASLMVALDDFAEVARREPRDRSIGWGVWRPCYPVHRSTGHIASAMAVAVC